MFAYLCQSLPRWTKRKVHFPCVLIQSSKLSLCNLPRLPNFIQRWINIFGLFAIWFGFTLHLIKRIIKRKKGEKTKTLAEVCEGWKRGLKNISFFVWKYRNGKTSTNLYWGLIDITSLSSENTEPALNKWLDISKNIQRKVEKCSVNVKIIKTIIKTIIKNTPPNLGAGSARGTPLDRVDLWDVQRGSSRPAQWACWHCTRPPSYGPSSTHDPEQDIKEKIWESKRRSGEVTSNRSRLYQHGERKPTKSWTEFLPKLLKWFIFL